MKKRIISLILSLAMLLSVLPVNGLYAEDNEKTVLVYQTLTAEAEKANGAEDSEKVTVKVSGFLPVDAALNVKPVSLSQDELVKYLGEEKADAINEFAAFDISITSDGKDFEPKDFGESVQVSVNPAMEAENDKIEVAHVEAEEEPAKDVPTFVNASDDLVFSTNSFSTYIFYTVDFHYGDNDECVFSIEGGSSILLSDLLAAIGYDKHTAAEITSVDFTNDELIAVEQLDGDWQLTSLAPFDTDEYLTVKFGDKELKVWVTDANHDNLFPNVPGVSIYFSCTPDAGYHDFTVYLQEADGTLVATGFDGDVITSGWVGTGGNYWYEMVDYNRAGDPNYPNGIDALAGASVRTLTLGAFVDLPCHKNHSLTFKRYPLNIFNDSVVQINQVCEAVFHNDIQYRTVEVYVNGSFVESKNVLFPDRDDPKTLSGKGNLYIEDLNVTPKSGYVIDTAYGNGTGKVADTANKTYRVYLTQQYNVTGSFDGGHGTVTNNNQTKINYGTNSQAMVFTPVAGYKITGVKVNGSDVTGFTDSNYTFPAQSITENKNVVAYTAPITYNIEYSGLDDATLSGNPTSYNVETATFTLNNPTKTGYTFTGWTGSNGTTPHMTVTIEKGSTGDKTFTANWLINEYAATAAIASGDEGIASTSGTNTYDYNADVTFGATLKPGYDFLGWYDSEEDTATLISSDLIFGFIMPDNDVAYYAKTKEQTVTYNYVPVCKDTVPSGTTFGSVTVDTETVGKVNGTPSSTATANAPTFKFVGWFDNAQGTGNAISTDAAFNPANKDENGLLLGGTFYAVFEYNEASYKVRHYLQNADDDGYTLYETDEENIGVIGQLTEAAAYTKSDAGYEHYTAVTPIEQQTVLADGSTYVDIYYNLDIYTITYVVDGTEVNSSTYKFGQTVADYTAEHKTNYDFHGWYSDSDCKTAWTKPATMTAGNITVYGYNTRMLGTLTVSKSGMADGETAIFTITGGNIGPDGIRIAVPNGESVTIKNLYVGEKYTVTEDSNWTWRYEAIDPIEVSLDEDNINGTASFVNTKSNKKWLDAFDIMKNLFTGKAD